MSQSIKLSATAFSLLAKISFILSVISSLFFAPVVISQVRVDSSQVAKEIRTLELGKPIERELKGGEVHAYQITLAANQYLHVVVDQRGIDVVVTLFGPDGKQLTEVDSPNGMQGPEPVSVVAETAGTYRLEVHSLKKDVVIGNYEIKIEALRKATQEDINRIAAERASTEAEKLRVKNTAASLLGSIEKYEEALRLWRTLKDKRQEAVALSNAGIAYAFLGKLQEGRDYLYQALQIWRDLNDQKWEATVLNDIGFVYDSLGEKLNAIEFYSQSLVIRKSVPDTLEEAITLHNIAEVYNTTGNMSKALEYYEYALALRKGKKVIQDQAKTLNGIGVAYYKLGKMDKAFEFFTKALSLRREAGDRRGEAATLHNIGALYSALGESQKALYYHFQALPLRRETGDKRGEGYSLNSIASAYFKMGDNARALEYFTQALSLWQSISDRFGQATTLTNIAGVHSVLNDNQSALHDYVQALELCKNFGDRRTEARTLYNLGKLYFKMGEFQKELDYYSQALQLSQAIEDREGEAAIRFGIARVERDRGNISEARRQIELCVEILESLRKDVFSQELRASFMASKQNYNEFYIDLLMQLYHKDSLGNLNILAFEATERFRARSLLETLLEAHTDIRQGVDQDLVERKRILQYQLNLSAERLMRLLNGKHTEEQVNISKKEIDAQLILLQEVESQIRKKNPRYAALTQPKPLGVKAIQEQLLDENTMLLEYKLGEERSFLWAITSTTIASFMLPKRTEIDSLARRVYNSLTTRNLHLKNEMAKQRHARIAQADEEYRKAATSLSQMILGPVTSRLGTKRLLIVTDGSLQYIPFGALPIPTNENQMDIKQAPPLISTHEIINLPSASVMAVLRQEITSRDSGDKTVSVLADPVFSSDDSRIKLSKLAAKSEVSSKKTIGSADSLFREGESVRAFLDFGLADTSGLYISRLPFSRQEAEAIFSQVPVEKGMKALDFAANHATATSAELSRYRIVHFATHGLLNSEHPELSGIVLSLVDEQGKPQDGFLRLHEIYNLNLPADLVVLSACQTALGKEIKGEGLIGLTRGFMYAGAARVVASLWKVDDEATAELMKRFYKGMLGEERLRPAAALRAAQVAMWKKKRWEFPYYWAAFVLQGEWK